MNNKSSQMRLHTATAGVQAVLLHYPVQIPIPRRCQGQLALEVGIESSPTAETLHAFLRALFQPAAAGFSVQPVSR